MTEDMRSVRVGRRTGDQMLCMNIACVAEKEALCERLNAIDNVKDGALTQRVPWKTFTYIIMGITSAISASFIFTTFVTNERVADISAMRVLLHDYIVSQEIKDARQDERVNKMTDGIDRIISAYHVSKEKKAPPVTVTVTPSMSTLPHEQVDKTTKGNK